jgi:CDP-4-dehydro-6-deoxyglucose reductase
MSLQPWRQAMVLRIKNETPDTKRFFLQIPELDAFDFAPGQFVTLDLPIHEKPTKRWRSYSIASWPNGTNTIELLIVLNPQGTGTPYLFNEIKEGDMLTLRGPQGVFTLKEPLDKDIYLICTGTGIAPFRSMVQHIHLQKMAHKKITLIYGCRKKENLMYFDELKRLEKEMSDFYYIPTLSREEWEGRSGYVHSIYEELCKNQTPSAFYLCGWREMIDEARKRITEMGYDKKDIHVELYG